MRPCFPLFARTARRLAAWFLVLPLPLFAVPALAAPSAPAAEAAVSTRIDGVDFTREIARGRLHRVAGERVEGEYIVVFEEGYEAAPLARELGRKVALERGRVWGEREGGAFRGMWVRKVDAESLKALLRQPGVRYVAENARFRAAASQSDPSWNLDRIDQRSRFLSDTYTWDYDGDGVNAYILDTGIRATHAEFGGRASSVYDAVGDGQNGEDCNGHGTHVAGVVGGATYGVAKAVTIRSIRVLDCNGGASLADLIEGIDWLTANHVDPAVALAAFSGPATPVLDEAIQAAIDAGIFFAVPAGNDEEDACYHSPARVYDAFTVSATRMDDLRMLYPYTRSNYGWCLDVFAPGWRVLGPSNADDASVVEMEGTSVAAAHAAGAAALLLEELPASTPADLAAELSARATSGVVGFTTANSPNRLLYTLGTENFGATPIPLTNGVPYGGFSGDYEDHYLFTFDVPPGALHLRTILDTVSGDTYLRVKQGSPPLNAADADCASNIGWCTLPELADGTWYLEVGAEDAFQVSDLRMRFDTDGGELENGVPEVWLGPVYSQRFNYFIEVPPGVDHLDFVLDPQPYGKGSSLFVRYGTPPTASVYDCGKPTADFLLNTSCSFSSPAAGTWYAMLLGLDGNSRGQEELTATYTLAPESSLPFTDGFESGDSLEWTSASP